MPELTKRMQEVLRAADLERGEINDVPLGTMYGLDSRGLIDDVWRRGGAQSTRSGTFPHYNRVKLTPAGIQVARSAQEKLKKSER
jgi:hypothetical protein